ncbi:MAG: S41 family peptidase [Lachnospiraceae bacterium]|nr:S41 family peptidase [Lachnospiraceae bacterium]
MENEQQRSGSGLPFFLGIVCGVLMMMSVAFILAVFLRMGVLRFPLFSSRGGELLDESTKQKIALIEDSIRTNFYRTELDDDALRDGFYRGMVDALDDPYSVYYTEEEFREIMSDIEGVYEGIGAYLMQTEESEYPVITGTISGSPAEAAGLVENDLLTAVEGETTRGLDLTTIVSRVKGKRGTTVNLTIQRGAETLEVPIVREQIESPTVVTEDPENGIGYLRITEFDDVTPDQFAEGLSELREKGMRGLLLDLRSNTGGNLDAVCDIARQILPEGVIVYTLDREGNREDYTCDGKHMADFPIVVLTNGYTASASEILAGAIRDHGLGKLVGTTTFGKGVVQRIYQLGDETAIKLTVESYYTPSGYDLNGVGIDPDEEVLYDSEAYQKDGTDNQRVRAEEILRGMLGS